MAGGKSQGGGWYNIHMLKYVFILGHNPEISAAAIKAVLPQARLIEETSSFLILDTQPIDPKIILRQLGGTIKVGQIISQPVKPEIIVEELKKLKLKGKLNFGISFYQSQPTGLGMTVKKQLRSLGISCRLVTSRDKILSSVVVTKNNCHEFLVLGSLPHLSSPSLKGGGGIKGGGGSQERLAKTCAVQEFEEYSQRDYGRPVRDLVSGSMPPKLAKIMINLAQLPASATILDPFCGSGTILQEALLLGYQNVIGSDVSTKAVADTKRNLEWFVNTYQPPAKSYQLIESDVRQLSQKIKSVDAIVTEPYLGPPLKGRETKEQIQENIIILSELYLGAFAEFKKILSADGKVIIIFPAFNLAQETLSLPILEKIKKLGFSQLNQQALVYSRPDQKVWRQIYIFSLEN